jgi:glycosyltransferase involved in cell wall biosynthesis
MHLRPGGAFMRRPSVCLLFSTDKLGGAERSLTRMALAASSDVNFTVATMGSSGPWTQWAESIGLTPLALGNSGYSSQLFRQLIALRRLVRELRNGGYVAVYVCGVRFSLAIRLLRPCFRRAKVVVGVRWNPASDSWLDRAFRLVEQCTSWLVDAYICNSRAAAETLERQIGLPGHKIHVVYNGLDVIPDVVERVSNRRPEVLTVANLNPRKGYIEYLEQVVPQVVKEVPEALFVIVGRDDMGGQVQRRIAELGLKRTVTFAGFQSDVSAFYANARVFTLPSLWNEGCPTSILEAMSHSAPVIAFEIDGIPELVENGRDGLLVRLRDFQAMSAAIVHLLSNPSRAESMGEAGRDKVSRRFRVEDTAKEHARIFSALAGDRFD